MRRSVIVVKNEQVAAAASIGGSVSVQIGAALGATLFPIVGPVGVVAIRQAVAAIALMATTRPRLRGMSWRALWPALLLGIVLVVMNLSLYAAVERVGLGLAVTLEFLGPLAVALIASRRRLDAGCAVAAGAGVILLTGSVPGIDVAGVGFGFLAAAAWAAYILVSQRAGRTLPGLQATAIASVMAAIITFPLLLIALSGIRADQILHVALIGLATGILSSALPYSIDLSILRYLRRETFGVLQSVHPAAAALAGLLILGQTLNTAQWLGLALITLGNVVAVTRPAPAANQPRALG